MVIFQPFPVRFSHQVGNRVFIVRKLSEHGARCCGEEPQIREADHGAVDRMGEEQEVDEAYGGCCAGQ